MANVSSRGRKILAALIGEAPLGQELDRLAARYYGSHPYRKPMIYMSEYDRWFRDIRHLPLRVLELGVHLGFSMHIWRDYFPKATIVGLDLDPKPAGFPNDPRVHFVQGSQDDLRVLEQAQRVAGGVFDIIIDDASHQGCATGRSFAMLFPDMLKPGGIYVIEDICSSFEPQHNFDATSYAAPDVGLPGPQTVFPSCQHGMVGVVKQLIDHAMAPTAAGAYTALPIERMAIKTNIAFLQKSR